MSAHATLIVPLVRHDQAWFVRLRVHRRFVKDGIARSVPGQRGLLLPVERVADRATL